MTLFTLSCIPGMRGVVDGGMEFDLIAIYCYLDGFLHFDQMGMPRLERHLVPKQSCARPLVRLGLVADRLLTFKMKCQQGPRVAFTFVRFTWFTKLRLLLELSTGR